ncbi:MAG: ABC transporter ATP-binding protein [Chloroflexota bacterium]|nr:ABC transporter ATP-binding protein [Chloroflexota bacterium]MDP6509129.1 ABC transporter ATP-binding protein [Chloroflexota bacterium]MDP6758705.1 ABC transporter ATP-binding protein [Chloroflexota bacterium]
MPGAPALAASGLSARYSPGLPLALDDVSMAIAPGDRVALVGPNGAGKSSLLKAAAGLLRPLRGEVRVLGHAPECCYDRVAFLPQTTEIDWRFPIDVYGFVLTGRYVHLGWLKRPTTLDRERTEHAIDNMVLGGLAHRHIGQLSGGQQQRLLIARALAQDAELHLFDEPATAVDASSRELLAGVLDELRERGRTAIVATHELDRVATRYDRTIYLSEGRIVPAPAAESDHHGHG